MRNHIKDMLLALADAEVDFVVAGGVAVVLHGVERVTLDLDVSVRMDPSNLGRFLGVMTTTGLSPRVPVPPEVLMEPDQVRMMVEEKHAIVFTFIDPHDPYRHVDVFLTQELRYERLAEDGVAIAIDGRTVCIASLRRLLAMKRAVDPPRPKDLMDIAELEHLEDKRDD